MKRKALELIPRKRRALMGRGGWMRCRACGQPFFTRWLDARVCAVCAAVGCKERKGFGGDEGVRPTS